MSAAIAMAPSPAPHDRPSFGADLSNATAASTSVPSPSAQRIAAALPPPPPPPPPSVTPIAPATAPAPTPVQRSGSGSPKNSIATVSKSSPPSASRNTSTRAHTIVKKEPSSPDLPNARHRPRKLDLSKNSSSNSPLTARPLTTRESGGLGLQEVGLACLSPGFVTQDPVMKEQLQRSMSVREHQRLIIESRLHQQQSARGEGSEHGKDKESGPQFTAKTPGLARKRGAPPGLSIVAPSHEQFANERVIQSAPLGQTFTGRHAPHPLTRHITNQPSNLASTSHIHHVPANQTNNRLPPISDVFGQGLSGHPESGGHALFAQQSRGPLASPGHPPPLSSQAHTPGRLREYKSAEEAQVELAGGRPELLPKLVHYGGHQPPTPPSPPSGLQQQQRQFADATRSASKRRTRAEYEEGGSPPLGNGRPSTRRGPFGEGRDSPETQRAKKEEFLRICERAWDLFHS